MGPTIEQQRERIRAKNKIDITLRRREEKENREDSRSRKLHSQYKNKIKRISKKRKLSYKEQLNHPNWKMVRQFILMRDRYKCRKCHSTENLHIHHTKYVGKFAWDTPPKYLKTLCEDCHKLAHNPDLLDELVEKRFNKQNNNTKNAH